MLTTGLGRGSNDLKLCSAVVPYFILLYDVYLFLRERKAEVSGGGAESERETRNLKQVPGSKL